MNINKKYIIALFLFLLSALLLSYYGPDEYVELPDNISDNESEALPLLSVPDDFPVDKEPGWWKHTGKSTVSSGGSGLEYVDDAGNFIDLEVLVNGEDADSFPGPKLSVNSQVDLEYLITNRASHALYNVSAADDKFGIAGHIDFLDSGKSITFTKSCVAEEGQFELSGLASAWDNNGSKLFTDDDMAYYFGIDDGEVPKNPEEIPEFPSIAIPVLAVLGMFMVFGKKNN